MSGIEKACPIIFRRREASMEVLAFEHPLAGKQFVKGTIEQGEMPLAAAERELFEESGVRLQSSMVVLGRHQIGEDATPWHFFVCEAANEPDHWLHDTADDHGHTFAFFWHAINQPLGRDWHPMFHEAFAFFVPLLRKRDDDASVLRP